MMENWVILILFALYGIFILAGVWIGYRAAGGFAPINPSAYESVDMGEPDGSTVGYIEDDLDEQDDII